MIESIENIIVNTLEGTVDVFLKTQIKVDAEFTLTVIKDHAQLNNLDYEHSGHTGFVSKRHFSGITIKTLS